MKWLYAMLVTSVVTGSLCSCGNNESGAVDDNDTTQKANTPAANVSVKEEAVSYSAGNTTMNSYVAYDESRAGPRPVVLVLPEWWGLTEYPRMRAKMLAEMGYLAMAVDIYGEGKLANNPEEAQKAATPFYQNPQLAKERMDAALAKVKAMPQADTGKAIAIGYCFGGSLALNYGKMGAPVLGVVSFHGGLQGVPPQKGVKSQFLVCHGAADNFVPEKEVFAFKKSMDSAGLAYTFKVYPDATHAFTNPNATEKGQEFNMPIRYNSAADTASWNDMKAFFATILK